MADDDPPQYRPAGPWVQALAIVAIFAIASLDALIPGFDPDPLKGYGLLIAGIAAGAALPLASKLLK